MEINVTKIVEDAACEIYSASRMELDDNAGQITWDNSLRDSGDFLELSESQLEELRDWFGEFGAWEENERAEWSHDEIRALLFQFICGNVRELDGYWNDDGSFDIPAWEA
jgi:hypothetical protein